ERGDLPTVLARTDPRRHTPSLAILLTSAAALLLTLTGTFNYTITLNVISRLLVFLCTAVALLVFRGRRTAPPARLRLPGGPALAVVTCAACLWLLGSSGRRELRDLAIALAAGALVFVARRAWAGRRRPGGRVARVE